MVKEQNERTEIWVILGDGDTTVWADPGPALVDYASRKHVDADTEVIHGVLADRNSEYDLEWL